jgi:hypothetical protein
MRAACSASAANIGSVAPPDRLGAAARAKGPHRPALCLLGAWGAITLCSKGHRYFGEACPVCGERRPGRRRRKTAARGYGGAWQRLSLLARQCRPWCSVCGTSADLTADHRDTRAKGRADLSLADVVVLFLVGGTGLEPVTSGLSSRRSPS